MMHVRNTIFNIEMFLLLFFNIEKTVINFALPQSSRVVGLAMVIMVSLPLPLLLSLTLLFLGEQSLLSRNLKKIVSMNRCFSMKRKKYRVTRATFFTLIIIIHILGTYYSTVVDW